MLLDKVKELRELVHQHEDKYEKGSSSITLGYDLKGSFFVEENEKGKTLYFLGRLIYIIPSRGITTGSGRISVSPERVGAKNLVERVISELKKFSFVKQKGRKEESQKEEEYQSYYNPEDDEIRIEVIQKGSDLEREINYVNSELKPRLMEFDLDSNL